MTIESLQAENQALALRLAETEEMIRAIRQGAVDAFVVEDLASYRIYVLEGTDRPYRLFVEQMEQGVATLHGDGTIVYCNRRLADLLKAPHEGLIGAHLHGFVAPDDRPTYDELLSRGHATTTRGEARLQTDDGGTFPASLTFEPLPQDCGGLIGIIVTDLTIQRNHEQLVAAQEVLRDADRRKNEFLALLAHELRNPLAPIHNAVEILRLTAGDVATVHSTSAMLERQVRQMARLVDDLLDASRISRNQLELHKERVELATVVRQAVESIRPLCDNMKHRLTVTLPVTTVYVDGDPVRLTQVFANLLDNACKYMVTGGKVSLMAEVMGGNGVPAEVVVRIRDGGIGIAPDQLDRIFAMFAQVDTSLERSRSGLGIGLTLAKSLVELHGGRIEAHSEGHGRGSEFVVRLPISPGRPPTGQPEGTEQSHPTAYRILVVDDNPDSAESLALLLKLTGHDTRTALDGVAAVEAAAAFRPDVMLLDVGMPKLNGHATCRHIRSRPWGHQIIMIATTGWGQAEDRRQTEEAGFDGHLVKPVDHEALMRLVASISAERGLS